MVSIRVSLHLAGGRSQPIRAITPEQNGMHPFWIIMDHNNFLFVIETAMILIVD
jgi:hypothetical protein